MKIELVYYGRPNSTRFVFDTKAKTYRHTQDSFWQQKAAEVLIRVHNKADINDVILDLAHNGFKEEK